MQSTQSICKIWRIGIYIRLSREDSSNESESESVTNQRAIIEKHIADFHDADHYIIVQEYVDDGISGTTDDERDSFQQMLQDIKKGRVNCVIVKDLARSFRNYSDQGYYLDDWFPRHNVRFISLFHQPLDSYKEPRTMRSIAVPIQGVMNENHCAETSDKVREVFDIKRSNGQHIGSFAPFGYLKHPQNKNALIVDKQAAAIVADIYSMFLKGMSKNAIVHTLNERGVLCPSAYKREVQGFKYTNPSVNPFKKSLWTATTITSILKNRMYCGDMVQGRFRQKSYKIHVQERVPEQEWFVVPNTHEAIINRDTFTKVQNLLNKDTRTSPNQKELYLFSGFLRCADCGKSMTRSKVKNTVYYFCRTYKDQSKLACTKHSIKHEALETAVLYTLQLQIYLLANYQEIFSCVDKAPFSKNPIQKIEALLLQKYREFEKAMGYKQASWQDWKDGEISRSDYRSMKENYEQQMKEIRKTIEILRTKRIELEETNSIENPILRTFRQFQTFPKLNREILIELVKSIEIHENQTITIQFNFSNQQFRKQD